MIQLEGDLGATDTLRFFEEKLGAGIWRLDVLTGQMQWSRGFHELQGLNPGTVAPSIEEFNQRVHPDDRPLKRDVGDMLLDGLPLEREFRIIRPNGRLRWVHDQAEILFNEAGEPAKLLGVALDITKNYESLQPLRAGIERHDALIRAVEGLVWTASSDGRITSLPNWKAAGQDGPRLVHGHGWVDLLHEEERDAALKSWSVAVETGRPYKVEHRLLQPDGAYRWFRCSAAPILTLDGSIQEWMGTSIDVHDQKQLEFSAPPSRLTGAQMRAARGILNWSVRRLAEQAGVSSGVVRRLEEYDGALPVSDESLEVFRKVLSDSGVELLFPQIGKPGVRPR
ncbi:PAS domain-containing protein [Bradyrhizobium sp. 186]|uniref:PAS domain-containing protein n=1 Tax=Bradyrhizobium sp. 186 TaxID=2782654 RepID=UPI00200123E6|nr:PAS domain-containing protein [Bradyrhizobium sp. 186]UPK33569.1 PAS domain-containing protein [Bradyrhizobium sp. 186]